METLCFYCVFSRYQWFPEHVFPSGIVCIQYEMETPAPGCICTHAHAHTRTHARTYAHARARAHTHTERERETCSVNTHRHGGSECEPSRGNSGNEKRPDAPPHTGHWCVCKRLPPSLSLVRSPARSLAYFLALCSLFIFIYLYLTPYTQVRKRTRTTWSVFSIAI